MKKETENNETAIATQSDNTIAKKEETAVAKKFDVQAILAGEFDIDSLPASERLELMREIMQSEAELELMALPMVNSRDIIGLPINVHDAVFKTIVDKKTGEEKQCVNFLCENRGDAVTVGGDENSEGTELSYGSYFTVLKGSNTFNDTYVTRFQRLRGVALMPLQGYNFVTDKRWQVAGNYSVVLRKLDAAKLAGTI